MWYSGNGDTFLLETRRMKTMMMMVPMMITRTRRLMMTAGAELVQTPILTRTSNQSSQVVMIMTVIATNEIGARTY